MQDSLLKKNSSIVTFAAIIIVTIFFSIVDISNESVVDQNVSEPIQVSTNIYLEQQGVGEIGKYRLSDEERIEIFTVSRVVDGDTIKVRDVNDEEYTVRLIGVNTPETVDPRRDVECFGKEASDYTKAILEGSRVYLISDGTQDLVDKYSRLLRYVVREDEYFVNYNLIRLGYAYEYTYQKPYVFQEEFVDAQKYAEDLYLGLWGNYCTK